jgi:hypothetical protein
MLHFHEILPAESTGLAVAGMGLPRDRIPLFDGEKQQNTLIPALRRENEALQVVDSMCVRGEFRYAAKQRNFFSRSGELFGRTVELQRNLSAPRISRGMVFRSVTLTVTLRIVGRSADGFPRLRPSNPLLPIWRLVPHL